MGRAFESFEQISLPAPAIDVDITNGYEQISTRSLTFNQKHLAHG